MKILIVDDQPARLRPLLEKLESKKIIRENISIVTNAMDARTRLSSENFDFLVLDICLPLRAEDDPFDRNSLELLQELVETDFLNRPRYILGLSAYEESASAAAPVFTQNTWALVKFSAQEEAWADQIVNAIIYAQSVVESALPVQYRCDLAVVVALQDPELDAVLRNGWEWEAAFPIDDTTFVRRATFQSGGRSFTAYAAAAPRMGMVSAALLSCKVIEILRPRLIAMAGICAGVRGKTELGDVLLADPSWDYQSGKRVKDKENYQFSISPHQLDVDPWVTARVQEIKSDKEFLRRVHDAWRGSVPRDLSVHIGPVASGSAVLADGLSIDEIKNQKRELLGIEMEIYGMYAAAHSASAPKPISFALKSVCDFADPDKKDDAQKYAAYTSAATLTHFVQKHMADLVKRMS